MRKITKFSNRDEVVRFLEGKNFKHYVPRKCEIFTICSEYDKYYCIEYDEDKVCHASIDLIENNMIYATLPFFDYTRPNDFKTKKQGEEQYSQFLEYREFMY